MKAKVILLIATLAVVGTALFVGSAGAGSGPSLLYPFNLVPLMCVDGKTQVQYDQYGYFDGRTRLQMESILLYGDPNGAVINGVWVQQLPPARFADYVGPSPYAPGAYVIHSVRSGFC